MKKLFFLIGLSICTIFACQKSEVEIDQVQSEPLNLITVKPTVNFEGALVFEDTESFYKAIEETMNASKETLNNWEQALGFTSARTIFDGFITAEEKNLNTMQAEANTSNGLFSYNKVDDVFELNIVASVVSGIVNKDRVVYIKDILYNFTEEGQLVLLNGSIEKLKNVEDKKTTLIGSHFFFSRTQDGVIERSCGYNIPDNYVESPDGTRQSILRNWLMSVRTLTGDNLWSVENFVDIQGISRKKNLFGNWRDYNTDHTLKYNFVADIVDEINIMNSSAQIVSFTKNHQGTATRNNHYKVAYYVKYFHARDVPYEVVSSADPIFRRIIRNEHTHRGMDGVWNFYECF